MNNLIEISTNHPDGVSATKEWCKENSGIIFCSLCHRIRSDWYPKPIDVVFNSDLGHRLNGFVAGICLEIFHVKFIHQIRKHLLTNFVLGKCFDQGGNVINDYITCYSTNPIFDRKSKAENYRSCKLCGQIWQDKGGGYPYFLRGYLSEARVYMDTISTMYLDEDLAMEVDFSLWPDAELKPVRIEDEPPDGFHLPFDPSEIVAKYPKAEIEVYPTAQEELKRKESWRKNLSRLKEMYKEFPCHELAEVLRGVGEKVEYPEA